MAKKSHTELLAWAAAIIQREQKSGTYGRVIVHLEKGTIVTVTIEKTEKPPSTDEPTG